jgi:hypothetical protein
MNLSEAILTGVISGLLSTLLTVGFRSWWLSVIEPWYENRVYQDAKIEGKWTVATEYKDVGPEDFVVHLERTGHTVKGRAVCTSGKDKGFAYDIEGTFKNLILRGTWHCIDQNRIEAGTVCLTLGDNGRKLHGFNSYYNADTNTIHAMEQVWVREAHFAANQSKGTLSAAATQS